MKKDDIVSAARDRMKEAIEWDRDNRLDAQIDLEMAAGMQWPDDIKQAREADGRPCLVSNRVPQFIRQVTGDLRRLNPAIRIVPGDSTSSKEEGELIRGIIRGIEYESNAERIYEGAAESAAMCGIGQFRILTDYENDESFNQIIRIERIHNPFAVYWDPRSRESTREDADWCFITQEMDEKDFEKAYGDKAKSDVEVERNTDAREDWRNGQKVVVAEYFWKEPVEKTIGLTRDGEVIQLDTPGAAILDFVKKRKVMTHKIMWAKVSHDDVLEGPQEFPSRYIPVIAVTGEEITVGDQIIRTSVHRFARDPQRMYNYWISASTEATALQPKAPYLVTAKQIAGQENNWAAANDANSPYLIYTPDDKSPPPMRMTPPVPSTAMLQHIALAADDMKAVTGIYDAALGSRSSETSGVAIRQRQMESDISTSIYADNLSKSIAHAGRVIVDMIPRVYDTNRVVPVVDEEDNETIAEINATTVGMDGLKRFNPISGAHFNVRVSVGPNYATRRQEAAEGMLQFIQAVPGAGAVAGDLIARSMEWPDADKLAKRLEKTLPPQLRDPQSLEPEEQQQMQAAMQQQQAQQAQIIDAMAQTKLAKEQASTEKTMAEAENERADTEKKQAETMQAQLELAMQSGQLNAAISQIVQAEVVRAIQGMAMQRGVPQTF